jgi:enamine deaminase RidA (YjgF/YER057c/UK114 family)
MDYASKSVDDVRITLASFKKNDVNEIHLFAKAEQPSTFQEQLEMTAKAMERFLREEDIALDSLVFARFFVSDIANQQATLALLQTESFRIFADCAKSIIQQTPLQPHKVVIWAYLIDDRAKTPGTYRQKVNGAMILRRGTYHHLWHTCLVSANGSVDSHDQTMDAFNSLNGSLVENGWTLRDNCLRTWLFIKDIDYNYKGVVGSRRKFFALHNMVRDTHYIASTAIEGRHADPHINVVLDAYSVGGIQRQQIKHLQAPEYLNPTHEYGVTFERGTSLSYGDRNHIFISGTASINNNGEILHANDVRRQVERTMENIAALLEDGKADLEDIAQMIIFVRDPTDILPVSEYMDTHYPDVPKHVVHASVCRPGWLVEIECLAITSLHQPDYPCF